VLEDCPAPYRDRYTSFAVNDTIYVGLGQTIGGAFKKDIWKYNVDSRRWKQGRDFPVDIRFPKSFSVSGLGFTVGTNSANERVLYQYVPQSGNWLQKSNLDGSSFNSIITSLSTNDFGYVVAGVSTNAAFLWRFNPISSEWTKLGQIPVAIHNEYTFCLSASNRIFLLAVPPDRMNHVLFEYVADNNTWVDRGAVAEGTVQGGFTINNRLYVNNNHDLYMYIPE
jgi:hypothetical protein